MATFYTSLGEIKLSIITDKDTLDRVIDKYVIEEGLFYIPESYNPDRYYIEAGVPIEKPKRPSILHEFDFNSKSWILPDSILDKAKLAYRNDINLQAGIKINDKYPDYTQRNILASGNSTLIESVWSWINSVRALSNIKTAEIDSAASTEAVTSIFDEFTASLANL